MSACRHWVILLKTNEIVFDNWQKNEKYEGAGLKNRERFDVGEEFAYNSRAKEKKWKKKVSSGGR
jgi:hypothetical protein